MTEITLKMLNAKGVEVEKTYPLSFGKLFMGSLLDKLGVSPNELMEAVNKNPIMNTLFVIDLALKHGARIQKKEYTLTVDDIADAWDRDDTLVERFWDLFVEGTEGGKEKAAL